ncbi:MAG: PorT family protein [Rudanella sp.]|nr:PorT family protein [Rudanella sp.]
MNKYSIFQLLLALSFLFTTPNGFAQATERYRFEVETGGGTLRLSGSYRAGYFYRQQLTGFVSPRVGVALGLNWGNSSNLKPLTITDPQAAYQPDPAQIKSFYQRTDQMTDLSLVWLPVRTRRHQIRVQGGVSLYRQRETKVDSLLYLTPRDPYYETIPSQTNTRQVVPVVSLGYDFRPSKRWSVGVVGTHYFIPGGNTTALSVRVGYRLDFSADSLGIRSIRSNELSWGIRAAGSGVNFNQKGVNTQYRLRFNGGVWAELPLSLTWSLRGEMNYAQRGYKVREVQRGNIRYLSAMGSPNYLELPLLFRHEASYRWHLYGGPYLAFFLNGHTESDGQPNPPTPGHTLIGLMLGASYNLTSRLAFDARYQRDMLKLSSKPYGGFHSFQAGLIYTVQKR